MLGQIGSGFGSAEVSGHIQTVHEAAIFSANRLYRLTRLTGHVAFRRGDELLAVCRHNRDGSYEILAFCNRTNGTSFTRPYAWAVVQGWAMFALSLALVVLVIGIVLAPLTFWNAWTMSTKTYPQLREAVDAMVALSRVRGRDELVRRIAAFNESDLVRTREPRERTTLPRGGKLFQLSLPEQPPDVGRERPSR